MSNPTKTIEISVPEIVRYLKVHGEFLEAVHEIARRRVALEAAARAGVRVTDEEIQDAADDFRALKGLSKKTDFQKWLDESRLTVDEYETYVRESITIAKFKEYLVSVADKKKYIDVSKRVDMLYEEAVYEDWVRTTVSRGLSARST